MNWLEKRIGDYLYNFVYYPRPCNPFDICMIPFVLYYLSKWSNIEEIN